MRVLAAMSGGVDSAVAAAEAVRAGHEVVGVHLALSPSPQAGRTGSRGCCTIEDAHDARRSADILGIPFYVWDLAGRFEEDVIDDFVAGYAAGRTPNPCVRCNERVKFAALMDKALALGFDAVATGHYARLRQTPDGPVLRRARDLAKDQSYVLAVVGPRRLGHALFPVGELADKAAVRDRAGELGLPVAAKPDSHDICFIPDGDTRGFLTARVPTTPGDILDESGAVVGHHEGALGYTVGQRRGLRLGDPAGDGKPRYVLSVSVLDNTVTVGPAERLDVHRIRAGALVLHDDATRVGEPLLAQVRAHGMPVPARLLDAGDDQAQVALDEPIRGVAPGQSLVLYRAEPDGDRVVASATIEDAA